MIDFLRSSKRAGVARQNAPFIEGRRWSRRERYTVMSPPGANERDLLDRIKALVAAGRYRVRLHAVRHMIEENFSEQNIVDAVTGPSKILEIYPEDSRCLLLGTFMVTARVRSPLHVVCDHSGGEVLDIATAYIPQRPWWIAPDRRGRSR